MRLILALIATLTIGAIAPQGRYTLRYLQWDGTGPFTVEVRTNVTTAPVYSFTTTTNKVALSNLLYDTVYYFAVTNSGGASTNFTWPQPETNYIGSIRQASSSAQGPWISISGSEITLTNPPFSATYWRLLSWKSNNITPYIHPQ